MTAAAHGRGRRGQNDVTMRAWREGRGVACLRAFCRFNLKFEESDDDDDEI